MTTTVCGVSNRPEPGAGGLQAAPIDPSRTSCLVLTSRFIGCRPSPRLPVETRPLAAALTASTRAVPIRNRCARGVRAPRIGALRKNGCNKSIIAYREDADRCCRGWLEIGPATHEKRCSAASPRNNPAGTGPLRGWRSTAIWPSLCSERLPRSEIGGGGLAPTMDRSSKKRQKSAHTRLFDA